MNEDMLEIMIGKYLDGQITHSEQQVLEAELDNNFRAKEFLQQMQDLHQCSREVIASEVLDRGKNAEEIFEQAWQHRKYPLIRIIKIGGGLRLAAGIAAGLVIGLALHFTILTRSTTPNIQREPAVAAISPDNAPDKNGQNLPSPQNVIRNVDWYTFTDENGDQWLIKGLRENTVRTAAFQEAI